MPAEIVLQLAHWNAAGRNLVRDHRHPCMTFRVEGASEAARILICETQSNNQGGLAIYRELLALLSGSPKNVCGGPVWPGCRTHKIASCRQILAINLGPRDPTGLDAWVQREWSSRFAGRAAVVPIAPSALAKTLNPGPHLGAWQIAFWSAGAHEKAIDVLRVAGIGPRKTIFISYVRDDAAPLADALWDGLGKLGFDVFLDRFTATLGQRFAEEIEERVATAEAVVLLQSPTYHVSQWVRREIAVARNVGAGILVVGETGSTRPLYVHPNDWLQHASSVWKQPDQQQLDDTTRFIARRAAMASLRASVYCERSMRYAALTRGLSVRAIGPGLFDVRDVVIAPTGRPPTLNDLHTFWLSRNARPLAVVGETQVLRPAARAPIEWVAKSNSIALRRRAEMMMMMQSIDQTGKP
jgi:hypothetical protein